MDSIWNSCNAAHRAVPGTCVSHSVSGACEIERCSPESVPFPPQPPPKVALLCSAGSRVLRHSPTSPERSCPPFGLWPSRTGLDRLTKTRRRSPGSRACCFSACAGSLDYAGPSIPLANLTWLLCCLPPLRNGVGILFHTGFSKLKSPRLPIPLSTLQAAPRGVACKTRGQDGFAALLSCRPLSSTLCWPRSSEECFL